MIIQGNTHSDHRGRIRFFNDFEFKGIKRFYVISPSSVDVIRAWQGHKLEAKYFFVAKGGFGVNWIEIDSWEKPSENLEIKSKVLTENKSEILFIPPGYANGFKALAPGSELVIFSDKSIDESLEDDFRFPVDYWKFKQEPWC